VMAKRSLGSGREGTEVGTPNTQTQRWGLGHPADSARHRFSRPAKAMPLHALAGARQMSARRLSQDDDKAVFRR
jgi:hypothetical protein